MITGGGLGAMSKGGTIGTTAAGAIGPTTGDAYAGGGPSIYGGGIEGLLSAHSNNPRLVIDIQAYNIFFTILIIRYSPLFIQDTQYKYRYQGV